MEQQGFHARRQRATTLTGEWPAQEAVAQLWPESKGGAAGLRSAVLMGPRGPRPASKPRAPAAAVMELRATWRATGTGWAVLTQFRAHCLRQRFTTFLISWHIS